MAKGKLRKSGASVRAVAGIFATGLALKPLGIIVGIIVARMLGPTDKGIFAFLMLIGNLLMPICYLGFGMSITYFISSKQYRTEEVGLTSVLVGVVHGALAGVIVWALWQNGWLGETGQAIERELLLPVLLILPLQSAIYACRSILVGMSAFGAMNRLDLISAAVLPISLIGFVVVGRMGVLGAVYAATAARGAMIVVALWLVLRQSPMALRLSGSFLRRGYSYGLRGWIGNLGNIANARLDHLLLGVLAPPDLLGNYSVAQAVAMLAAQPSAAIVPVLFNRIAAAKDEAERVGLTERVHRALLLLMVGVALALAVSVPWLVPLLYGEAFADAVVPTLLLLPGVVAMLATRRCLGKFFTASGMPGRNSVVQGLGGLIGSGFYLLLIPFFGLVGASAASSLGDIAAAVIAYVLYRHTIRPLHSKLFAFTKGDFVWLRDRFRDLFQDVLTWVRRRRHPAA